MKIASAVLSAFLFLAAPSASFAATFFQYLSQRGDVVGQGQSGTVTTADAPFTAYETNGHSVIITVGTAWNLRFEAAGNQPLAAGVYENVRRTDPSAPGLDVSGMVACGHVYGRFTVLEFTIGPGDTVASFAADFEQHCEGDEAALYGGIRFNSSMAYTPPTPPPFGFAGLTLMSQVGDDIVEGRTLLLGRDDAIFRGTVTFNGGVEIRLSPPPGAVSPFWNLVFSPAPGQALGPGVYENAQRDQFNTAGHPGMDVSGNGRGCGGVLSGRFTVLEVEYGPIGSVTKFAADLEQHCDDQLAGLYGAVRFNSTLVYTPPFLPLIPNAFSTLDGFTFPVSAGGTTTGPRIEVHDYTGLPVPGARVHFAISDCGSFQGAQSVDVTTNSSGIATSPMFTAPATPGFCNVIVTIPGSRLAGTISLAFQVQSTSNPAQQHATAASPSGLGTITASLFSTQAGCTFAQPQFFPAGSTPAAPPAHFTFPFGLVSFHADNCGTAQAVDFVIEYPQPLPPLATFWRFGPTRDNRTPHWYAMAATIDGSQAKFHIVDGGDGDDDLVENGSIALVGGVMAAGGIFQDMWWSGPAENGWGMSVVHHGDTLFSVIYAYDAAGNPTWYVMPGGAWNNDMSVYSGPIYTPRGTPFFAYDASHLAVGAPVGTLSIKFTGSNSGRLDYTINGVAGSKSIQRQAFGVPSGTNQGTLGDMWWGGPAQNGWGIAMLHQYSTMFLVWFTYDASGIAKWYVMPGGAWTSTDVYEGHVYRTTGSPWAGAPYDPAALKVFDAGTYRVRFAGDAATFEYNVDGHAGSLPLVRQPF